MVHSGTVWGQREGCRIWLVYVLIVSVRIKNGDVIASVPTAVD